jgi:hypothetical protein
MSVEIFGIRHHGPGCARALRVALERLTPDIVLVEGPPDAQDVLPLLPHEQMRPPVALLIYAPETPAKAVYYPFARFSPEWQALDYALARGIPARFIDLPQAIQLAKVPEESDAVEEQAPAAADAGNPARSATTTEAPPQTAETAVGITPREDPLALLALAAGYSDHELWWERQIEQRRDLVSFFEGILEAMTTLRADTTPKDEEEAQREAHMRQGIRAAVQEGYERVVVVCGAWHAPALASAASPSLPAKAVDGGDSAPPSLEGTGVGEVRGQRSDAALLSGLKRVKVQATWIPWTNSRLAHRSGYGAGVTSPGWYEHLWTTPDAQISSRWMAKAARLLRTEGLDASSASVIEAVRLAEALAAMRDLPLPGLAEMHEATQTVLCGGEAARMQLVRDKLEIGEAMGAVPPETPAVPLQRDLEAQQRRLRLAPSVEIKQVDFDLRNETDRARSRLLHRLRLLGIEWGKPQHTPRTSTSTFHELWQLQWQPEFVIRLIEANIYGITVARAATAFARSAADKAADLPTLTDLLNRVTLAELPEATEYLLARVQSQAAVSADVRHLMDALPPLANLARYSDVRGTTSERIVPLIDTLFARVLVGLPLACTSLDDDAAAAMVDSIEHVQSSLDLLDRAEPRGEWQATLRGLAERERIHGLVRGWCCRLLLEHGALDEGELQRLARLALSPVNPAPQAAAWVEGVLRGSGVVLLHQDGLWHALDGWLRELSAEAFVALLPLLRRAFSGFQPPERRAMGDKVKRLRADAAGETSLAPTELGSGAEGAPLDRERADRVLPILARILGQPVGG